MYVGDMSNGYIEQPVSNSAAAAAPPNQTGNTTLNFSFFSQGGSLSVLLLHWFHLLKFTLHFFLYKSFFSILFVWKNGNRFDLYF